MAIFGPDEKGYFWAECSLPPDDIRPCARCGEEKRVACYFGPMTENRKGFKERHFGCRACLDKYKDKLLKFAEEMSDADSLRSKARQRRRRR